MQSINSLAARFYKKAAHFFFEERRNNSYLLYLRILMPLLAIVALLAVKDDLLSIYGEQGIIARDINEAFSPDYLPKMSMLKGLFPASMSDDGFTYAVIGLYMASLILVMLGLFTRVSALMAWLLCLTLNSSSTQLNYGFYYLMNAMLFYCFALPVGRVYSLDNILFRRKNKSSTIPVLYLRVLQVHICLIYFFAGIAKDIGTDWWDGNAALISLNRPPFDKAGMWWLINQPAVASFICYMTLFLETAYIFLVWIKKTRPLFLLGIFGLHAGIFLLMDLQLFATIMIFYNMITFGSSYLDALLLKIKEKASSFYPTYNKTMPHLARLERTAGNQA